MRFDCAQTAFDRGVPDHSSNGDEGRLPGFIGNYSKGLPHNLLGGVDPNAYQALLGAVNQGTFAAFEGVPMGGQRLLTNPLAGMAFDLEGPDSHALAVPPAPSFDSAAQAADMAEVYWMALLRDVRFTDYGIDPVVAAACQDLGRFNEFQGVVPDTLFRGSTPGDRVGPYLSQFLWQDVPFGALTLGQRMRTLIPGVDFLTDFASWLGVQNGGPPAGAEVFDGTPRYIRNLRDMSQWVHVDALYQAYLQSCLILLGLGVPTGPGNPYRTSRTQAGFGTFGGPHILSLVTEVATRALKAIWYQKWFVHRRLRPEEFGGRVHLQRTGQAGYPIHPSLLSSPVLDRIFNRYGTFLLPMVFPEGCPTHPSYGAGHATVAGACTTILKAWFDESFVLPNPVVPDADGLQLIPYAGPGAGQLTVGGELNKVAANVAIGRNGAGVHYRTDYWESVRLGERLAIGVLEENKLTMAEDHFLRFTSFDGTLVTV
ncbi:MAG: vanadium-dependent haloperoxidase [Armatimonadetes bacterium]|nr:vanadium-dependent haloperoxidase [Armatimonadota bacterium]